MNHYRNLLLRPRHLVALALVLVCGSGWARAQASAPAAPLSFTIGAFNFTPGGFLDFTTVYRSTNVGGGIGTAFAKIPYNGTLTGRLAELRESAQNSRLTLKAEGRRGGAQVTVYLETDFLGNAPSNLAVSSNSDTLRMRVYFLDLRRGAWELLAGQDWSLLTPNRTGLSPMPSGIFYTQVTDTNYQVGLVWARQPQFRLTYHASPAWTVGLSVENGEAYIGGSGAPTVTLPGGANGPYSSQLDNGASGVSAPGFIPDFVVKAAYDSVPSGRGLHLEAAGLASTFRILNPATGVTHRAAGGALSLNGNLYVGSGLRLIANTFFGDGGGRYLFGMAPDLIVRPDGAISPVRASGGLAGLEWQATPQQLFYAYYGGVYIHPGFDLSGATPVGYGFPDSPNSINKTVQEATAGLIRTFWKSASLGSLQFMLQASYVLRNPYTVAPGSSRNAHAFMSFVNLRYNLP